MVSLSGGSITGIVFVSLVVITALAGLVFFILRRYRRHRFARVANPAHDGALDLPRINSRTSKTMASLPKNRPVSSEPLVSPVSWPPIPPSLRAQSPVTPRSYSVSPPIKNSTDPVSAPSLLQLDQTPPSPDSQHSYFVHRMLQSRARASESASLTRLSSLGFVQSPTETPHSSAIDGDVEQLLAEAERTALQNAKLAEIAEREKERLMVREGNDEDSESIYSQSSARPDDLDSAPRRGSLRRQKSSRTPAELAPVTELPDPWSTPAAQTNSRPVSSVLANSSVDVQVSHGTPSRPMSPIVDHSNTMPLLTSTNFGKESTTSGTTAGSMSSGRASRYPSLAPSSVGLSSGPRSDGGTDWRHTPPGLSGLQTLQFGSLQSPHSPSAERPGHTDASQQAHLREMTTSSIPEVERRRVTQGGIASIDVAL